MINDLVTKNVESNQLITIDGFCFLDVNMFKELCYIVGYHIFWSYVALGDSGLSSVVLDSLVNAVLLVIIYWAVWSLY